MGRPLGLSEDVVSAVGVGAFDEAGIGALLWPRI